MQVFTEKSFMMNGEEYVRFYTGLTNFEVLHAVFDFVVPPAIYSEDKTIIFSRVCVDDYQIEARSSI